MTQSNFYYIGRKQYLLLAANWDSKCKMCVFRELKQKKNLFIIFSKYLSFKYDYFVIRFRSLLSL